MSMDATAVLRWKDHFERLIEQIGPCFGRCDLRQRASAPHRRKRWYKTWRSQRVSVGRSSAALSQPNRRPYRHVTLSMLSLALLVTIRIASSQTQER